MPEPLTLVAVGTGLVGLGAQLARRYFEIAKEIFDIIAGAMALVVFLPVMVVCACIIKLSSRGPVVFRQVRLGKDGRPFVMLKIRSMYQEAPALRQQLFAENEVPGPVFKIRSDPRVSRVGHLIRKYSLDELPQLWNVLRGEMSLVGPRPPIPDEVARYHPWQRERLQVPPRHHAPGCGPVPGPTLCSTARPSTCRS